MTKLNKPRVPASVGRLARAVLWLSRLYVLALIGLCVFLWTLADIWWPATVVMYVPRWGFGLPLIILVPAALRWRPRSLRLLLLGALVWLWPLMDLCLPWRLLFAGDPAGLTIRVLTCNTHYKQLNPTDLRQLLEETNADVIALQYWDGRYEKQVFEPSVLHTHAAGEFFVASRFPIRDVEPLGTPPMALRCELDTAVGRVHFVSLHLATPRDGLLAVAREGDSGIAELEANITRRRDESKRAAAWLRDVNGPLIIVGDFNTTVESAIFREYWSKYTDAFTVAGCGWGPTQITPRRTAARIDHVLVGPGWRCRQCWVGPFVGSEHRPVAADLEWVGAP
jgi:endonuclease/exonuclease/phosphatase family metal-dependent hydrolase